MSDFYKIRPIQTRSQKCEIGGGANDESGGAVGRAPKARESRRHRHRGSRHRRRRGGGVWGGGVPSGIVDVSAEGAIPFPQNFF